MAKAKQANQFIKIKLIKSLSGRKPNHIACAHGLGLKKIGQTVEVIDTPENRGMVNQIPYLISLEG